MSQSEKGLLVTHTTLLNAGKRWICSDLLKLEFLTMESTYVTRRSVDVDELRRSVDRRVTYTLREVGSWLKLESPVAMG